MSKPSFSNIDLWLFELAEGNLTEAQIEQLELFIFQHPELDIEKDAWESARVSRQEVDYEHTDRHLKRKPVALYSAAGMTAVFMLTFLGCYNYLTVDKLASPVMPISGQKVSGISGDNVEAMKKEISKLKRQIEELEELNVALSSSDRNLNAQESNTDFQLSGNELLAGTSRENNNAGTADRHTSGSMGTVVGNEVDDAGALISDNRQMADNSAGYQVFQRGYHDRILKPREAVIIDFEPGWTRAIQSHKAQTFNSSGYERHVSFKTRVDRMARSVQRMMDNPIALKNSRDPQYLVPGVLPQDVNFGAVGTLLRTRVQTLSRLQWQGTDNEQMINQLAIDGYAYGVRGGFGIQLNHRMYNDGGIHVGDVAVTYSPKFSVSNVISVEPAIRFKMGNKMLDHKKMGGVDAVETDRGNIYDYYPDGSAPIGRNLWYKDMGAGLMVNTKWFFAGVQGDNLFHHKDNIYSNEMSDQREAPTEIFATVGTDWESRSEKMMLSPYFVFHKYGALNEAWLGLTYRWSWFTVGAAVSSNSEPSASIGIKFDRFALSYSADYLNSSLLGTQSLSHQLSLKVQGKTSRIGQRILKY